MKAIISMSETKLETDGKETSKGTLLVSNVDICLKMTDIFLANNSTQLFGRNLLTLQQISQGHRSPALLTDP